MRWFQQAAMRRAVNWFLGLSPIQQMILGYVSYVIPGWLLLCCPLMHETTTATPLDHLFTATSAMSTTGLVTVSTSKTYSFWGELVVLVLIQLGGLGYMTASSFVLLAWTGQLSQFREGIAGTALQLPAGFQLRQFLRLIVLFTASIEILGAICLYPAFVAAHADSPLWQAIFHSVSAFCTAGFGLYSNSLEDFRDNPGVNLVIAGLSLCGAIGFIVIQDLWRSLRGRRLQLTYTSQIVLGSTFSILMIGTLIYGWIEPSSQQLPLAQRWMSAAFQVMTASTTVGFNTTPIGELASATVVLLLALMVVGASPSGTGGGVKTTTITALWAVAISVLRRRESAEFLGRTVPLLRIRTAVANVTFYLATLALGVFVLALTEDASLMDLQFEVVSALGTVGLSRGLTSSLSTPGTIVVIALMFLGRIGPLAIGLAFFIPRNRPSATQPEEDLVV